MMKVFLFVTMLTLGEWVMAKPHEVFTDFEAVMKTTPHIDTAKATVWSIRKNERIRINLVRFFKGELGLHTDPDADHSLMLIKGSVKVQIGDEFVMLSEGGFVSVPKGVPHKYWTLSETALLVSMDAPYYDPKKIIRLEPY